MAALSDHPSQWRRITSMTQMQQLPQLPETIEEVQENVSEGHSHGLQQQEEEDQLRQIEEDLQSELSFASAYSHPRDSPKTLQRMETTV